MPGLAPAATITVDTDGDEFSVLDDGLCALREAVESVNTGIDTGGCIAAITPDAYGTNDTIHLPSETYSLFLSDVPENLNATGDLDVLRDLVITGTGNPTITQSFLANDRILHVPGTGDSLTLNNLTVSGGEATGGGPFENWGGNILFEGDSADTLTLNDAQVLNGLADNVGGRGGGIAANNGGNVVVQADSVVRDNVAGGTDQGVGGGIDMLGTGGSLSVTDSEISSNDANFNGSGTSEGFGGGVSFGSSGTSTITLTGATIEENRAGGGTGRGAGSGGGILVGSGGTNTLTADGGSISNNEAGGGSGWMNTGDSAGFGGGINYAGATGSSAELDDVDVIGNKAGGNGGRGSGQGAGVRVESGDLTVEDSNVSGNLAGVEPSLMVKAPDLNGSGGGILTAFTAPVNLTVTDSTVSNNKAGDNFGFGGGVDMESVGNLEITGSNIAGNAAGSSAATGTAQGGGVNRVGTSGAVADTITRTTISSNTTAGVGAGAQGAPSGAGVASFTTGSLMVDSSTISGNTATSVNGNPAGGGLYLDSDSTAPAGIYTLTNSTVSGNTATSAVNQGGNGGGIATGATGATNPPNITLTHVTVAGNTATPDANPVPFSSGRGGNLFVGGSGADTIDLRATIIAGGSSGVAGNENCRLTTPGLIESLGENLEQTTPTQCELDGVGDQVGVDPMLGALALNPPGTTQTRALLAGSPAIDSVPAAGCPATDQRGVTRPQLAGGACDAGAYELTDIDGDGSFDTSDNCPAQSGPASNSGCPLAATIPPLTQPPSTAPPTKKKKCKKKAKKGAAAAKKCKRKRR